MKARIRDIALSESFLAASLSIVCFAFYLTTMCPTVSFIDAGELATVASILGIAHPTGYPMFTLLSHCFLLLPLGGEEVMRLNILSCATVAMAVGMFSKVLLMFARITDHWKTNSDAMPHKAVLHIAAGMASLVFAFSTTVWAQSVSIEVYGFHLLLVLLTVFAILKGVHEEFRASLTIPRWLFAGSFLLGLSFSNHLTTLLVVPPLVYLYLKSYGVGLSSRIRLFKLTPFFFLGLSPYLFLPIRARVHPPLDWGYPAELERLLWHVSGKQYRNWMFSSFDSAEKQLSYFFNHFSSEFNWLVIVVLLFGVWRLFRWNRMLFWFLIVAFVSCLFYSINYDIHDIDSYFLLAYIVAAVFAFFGIIAALERAVNAHSKVALISAITLLLVLPIGQELNNRREVSEADNFLVADYTHNALANIEPRSLVISYQWDYFVSASLYYQFVRSERTDVTIIDKELLRRSWYFIHLKKRYPWLIERSQAEVDAFLGQLYRFEHNLPYDPREIESSYVGMINSFIDRSLEQRPVYIGPEIEPEFAPRYARIPSGLFFKLERSADSGFVRAPILNYRRASIDTRLTQGMRGLYARMLTTTAAALLSRNDRRDASNCIENAILIEPTYQPAHRIKEEIDRLRSSDGF